jgi:uncharacterized membrane protein YfcA
MFESLTSLPEGLSQLGFWVLMAASFIGSFITAALGIGGGALVLVVMASVMPPAAIIPVHGVVQLGSNAGRAAMLMRHVHRPALPGFLLGSVIGSAMGGVVVVDLPPGLVQIGLGLFIIWSVLAKPPAWLTGQPWIAGGISSFLTMFFGATGVFVANFTKSFRLDRHAHVATHATLMTAQHLLKVLVFGLLGFAFGAWAGVIVAMIVVGLVGTYAGKLMLNRMSDRNFKIALDGLLILISLRLIYQGLMG